MAAQADLPATPERAGPTQPRTASRRAGLLDWFIPDGMQHDAEARRRAQMFLISHFVGPCLGLTILSYLYDLDPARGFAFWISVSAIVAFWMFPFALRLTGSFVCFALLSLQNLAFVVLFTSFHYGGVSSPFLPWLITIPLLAFFYLGERKTLLHIVLATLVVDLAIFYLAYRLAGGFPAHVPLEALSTVGIVSIFCAGLYVTMMALYYARIVASRSELAREVLRHKATAVMLVEAKDSAEAANRAKTEFLATMSHELRTPLNAVIGFSEMMVEELFGPLGHDNYRGYAKDVQNSGQHLLAIINDILDIAKAESGKVQLTEEILDCQEVIQSVSRLLRPRVDKAGLALVADIASGLPHLRADSRKVKQILLNLLTNAVKFTPSGGRVEISASAEADRGLAIVVSDTGTGIAQEHLAKVLEPFTQVDGSLSRRHEGTGLGLPLVVLMMNQHGGTLQLESGVGKGTTARVTFPPARLVWPNPAVTVTPRLGPEQSAPDLRPAAAATTSADAAAGSATILVVEDDDDLRELLRRILHKAGFSVRLAVHGRDGLKRFRECHIDVVVTDMLMPEMDGVELMRALIAERPSLPIIAISGVDEWTEYLRIATHLGARATLRKPVSAAQLTTAVQSALAEVRRRHALPFDAEDHVELPGRGLVLTGPCPIDTQQASELVGRRVLAGGKEYEIAAVEWHALTRGPLAGDSVSLIVHG